MVRWGYAVVALAAVLLNRIDPASTWWGLRNLTMAALFATLTLAVVMRSGGSREQLGFGPAGASTAHGRAQGIAVGAAVGLAAALSMAIVSALPTFLDGASPYGSSQSAFLGWTNYWLQVANVFCTGVIEDVVMVGAVVRLLTVVRRPAVEMYALSVSVEVGMHLYFGVPAVGIALVAAVSLALYRATGRLTPIVIGHIGYDLGNDLPLPAWALGLLLAATALASAIVASVCPSPARKADVHGRERRRLE
ncbi:CPBP family glutamic-type intramembrane protease [Streptomyces inhibens]|uniref:CPBP family glutamic-type intramembrane protease n=1 Tax=Streptomyces inhibens TaxID=2293571 RepID=UPI00402AA830